MKSDVAYKAIDCSDYWLAAFDLRSNKLLVTDCPTVIGLVEKRIEEIDVPHIN